MYTRVLIDRDENSPTFAMDDRIFLGEGLFETLKVDSSKPCFSYLHWERMKHSASTLSIPFDLSFDDWQDHLIQQIKCDNLYHGGVKVILSGGPAPRGLAERGLVSQLLIQTFNYTIQTTPIHLLSAAWLRDPSNPIYQLKSVNYLEAIIARRQALHAGADDVLFFNTRQHATETSCANIFLIKKNELITPPLNDGVLAGVTRKRIMECCTKHQISCFERPVTQSMIQEADALFISNSLQGIRIVKTVDEMYFTINHPLIDQLISSLVQC